MKSSSFFVSPKKLLLTSGQTVQIPSSWKEPVLHIFLRSTGQKALWGKEAGKITLGEMNTIQKSHDYQSREKKKDTCLGSKTRREYEKTKMAYDLAYWHLDFQERATIRCGRYWLCARACESLLTCAHAWRVTGFENKDRPCRGNFALSIK